MVSFGSDCVVFSANQYPAHAAGNKGNVSHSFSIFKKPTGINVIREIMELKTKNADKLARN